MKRALFIMLSCILLIGCGENTDYNGIDPQLNIEEYIFPKEGGTLDIYSTIGDDIYVPTNYDKEVNKGDTIIGSWYKVIHQDWNKKIFIEVYPNDTGKDRELPITIWSGNFRCKTNYTQKGN